MPGWGWIIVGLAAGELVFFAWLVWSCRHAPYMREPGIDRDLESDLDAELRGILARGRAT